MDFTYSDEQNAISTLANQIFQEQVTWDRHKNLEQQLADNGSYHDEQLWSIVAEAGLLGIALDEQYGGMGFGYAELSLLFDEAGKVLAPLPLIPTTVCALAIQQFAPAEHKELLQHTASGKTILTAALTETAQQDPMQPSTSATFESGQWVLNGNKLCVPFAHVAEKILVSAATGEGPALFVIDAKAQGLSMHALLHTTLEPNYEMVLEQVTAEYRLGDAQALQYLVDRYSIALCSYQVGCTDTAMSMTAKYVAEREQFGVKIGTFQAVGHRAANMFIDVTCLRLVTLQAASLLHDNRDAQTAVLIAKSWAGDAGHRVSYASQHLHGGFGVDRDYGLWRYATRCKHNELTLGSSHYLLDQLGKNIAAGQFNIE